ncbi:hypothetical protein B0H13DRAFT_2382241 [Mycena leptocephala]|nr:hypothetical protein B0H13DRAFT_2382241 [Mycena leptocephala]
MRMCAESRHLDETQYGIGNGSITRHRQLVVSVPIPYATYYAPIASDATTLPPTLRPRLSHATPTPPSPRPARLRPAPRSTSPPCLSPPWPFPSAPPTARPALNAAAALIHADAAFIHTFAFSSNTLPGLLHPSSSPSSKLPRCDSPASQPYCMGRGPALRRALLSDRCVHAFTIYHSLNYTQFLRWRFDVRQHREKLMDMSTPTEPPHRTSLCPGHRRASQRLHRKAVPRSESNGLEFVVLSPYPIARHYKVFMSLSVRTSPSIVSARCTLFKGGRRSEVDVFAFQSPTHRACPFRRLASWCCSTPSRIPWGLLRLPICAAPVLRRRESSFTVCTQIAYLRCEPTLRASYSIHFFGVFPIRIHDSVSTAIHTAFSHTGAFSIHGVVPVTRLTNDRRSFLFLCIPVSHRARAHTHPYLNQPDGPSTHPNDLLQRRPLPCRASLPPLIAPPSHHPRRSRWSVVKHMRPD